MKLEAKLFISCSNSSLFQTGCQCLHCHLWHFKLKHRVRAMEVKRLCVLVKTWTLKNVVLDEHRDISRRNLKVMMNASEKFHREIDNLISGMAKLFRFCHRKILFPIGCLHSNHLKTEHTDRLNGCFSAI